MKFFARTSLFLALVAGAVSSGWSQMLPLSSIPDFSEMAQKGVPLSYVLDEKMQILREYGTLKLTDLTLAQFQMIAGRINVAEQKDQKVKDAVTSSFLLPGLVQWQNGDWPLGLLFSTADAGILAGAFTGAWELYPWNTNNPTIVQELPSLAVLIGGFFAWQGLGFLAAPSAVSETKRRIDSGGFQFIPNFKDEAGISITW